MIQSGHVAARLDAAAVEALTTIIQAISVPHRRPASASEAVRAAVLYTAQHMSAPAISVAPNDSLVARETT